ncbi:MAG: NAD(P)-dependent oxidoreductase [Planctomycetia bacterium]|nr:NAD(P)-dependent oxidoreductase [Planctomycetia bacterium]
MRVLITGAAGYIGRRLTRALGAGHELRLGDVVPIAADRRFVPCDVTNPEQVAAAIQGIDAVIHLAIAAGREGDFEDDEFNQRRFDINVRGTFNVLEAAVASDAPACPVGTYAKTKQLAEILCGHAALESELSVICLRIAKPIDLDDSRWKTRPVRPQWVPFPDLEQAYRLALTATRVGFEIVTIVGESSRRRWDLSKAERVLGYRPRYRLEDLGYTLGSETEPFET